MNKTYLTLLISLFLLQAIAFPIRAEVPAEQRTSESAITPVERSRHAGFLRQIREGNGDFDFVLIGDSITDGWPGKGKETYARFAPWKPLDLGVSGETTEEVLWRLLNGELDGIHPKVVMLLIGTNNLGRYGGEKPEWVAAGISKILETIRAKQPQAKILLLAIFPREATANDPLRMRVAEVNKLLPAMADGKNIYYLDIGPKFMDPQGNLPRDLMPDLLHPGEKGYGVWIEAVGPKLEELMGSPLAPAAPVPTPSSASTVQPNASDKNPTSGAVQQPASNR
jgi:beta-glucosidase